MAGKILTLLANGSFNTEFTLLLQKNTKEMISPDNDYGLLLQTNYNKLLPLSIPNKCFSLGESTTRRSQNTSYLQFNLDLDNNYPQQYPITLKNSPNYPITQNYQYHSRISIFLGILLVIPRTILLVQGITQIALQLLIISTIRTFT